MNPAARILGFYLEHALLSFKSRDYIEIKKMSKEETESKKTWSNYGLCPPAKLMRTGSVGDDYETERDVTYSELFYDLILVVGIARLGEALRDGLNEGAEGCVGKYILYFLIFVMYWNTLSNYSTRYGDDCLFNKVMIIFYMGGVLGMVCHAAGDPSSKDGQRFAICASIPPLTLIVAYVRVFCDIPGTSVKRSIYECVIHILVVTCWLIGCATTTSGVAYGGRCGSR